MADTRADSGNGSGSGKVLGGLDSEAADRLKSVARDLAMAEAEKLLMGVGRKLGQTTGKLTDVAEGRSPGFAKLALESGRKVVEGKGPVRGALEAGASQLKDKAVEGVKSAFQGGGKRKKGGGQKPVVILEHVDVGVPLRDAYDQWTQLQDFSSFTKGVKDVTVADDTSSDWKLKIFWSNRSWRASTTEQVPDQRISWTSEGAKGSTKGVVTFHELAPTLTRVVLVIEYYPKGLFEKTGNIWRAQGRRARLDLKHFARHISMKGEADEGWRGEIRDGEVVTTHEDAVAEEEGDEAPEDAEAEESEEPRSEEDTDEAEADAADDDEADTDEADDEYVEDAELVDEPDEEDEPDEPEELDEEDADELDEEDEEPEEEPEEEYAEAGERR
ncbi:SRPBCC family protein [Streptomyces sp. NBC_01187]|uniref:SRPBCC family protein n=1 Tax=unclassified Streptomyces TaxID=2593676 RepID=UPI00386A6686